MADDGVMFSEEMNIDNSNVETTMLIGGKLIQNIDLDKMYSLIGNKELFDKYIEEKSIETEKIDEKKLEEAIGLIKSIPKDTLLKNGIQFKDETKDETKDEKVKKDKEEIKLSKRRNPSNDEINCHKPACYTQCNVPNFGFRNGWSGPDFWPFARGCPYNEAFSR
jgi:hypothetical protein